MKPTLRLKRKGILVNKKIYNFSAGPAVLPEEVLHQAQQALVDWQGCGTSILSVSHRSNAFLEVVHQSKQDLADLLELPKNYHILFLQGGATAQFSMVPMNLLGTYRHAVYVDSGHWSQKAIAEARNYGEIEVFPFRQIAQLGMDRHSMRPADYLHFTPNETIEGIAIPTFPNLDGVPLVGDFSSVMLSEPIGISDFGLIYAGAQKNLGPAGITLVLIRDDLVREALPNTPAMYRYQNHVSKESLYNTPPTFSWYVVSLVLAWLKQQGGLAAMAVHNQKKAALLYNYIDQSTFYRNEVNPAYRSKMNVVFRLPSVHLEKDFIRLSAEAGLLNLAGHRSIGGIRASIYNAMPLSGVQALVAFMQEFEENHEHS